MKFESKFNHGDFVYTICYKDKYKEIPNGCKTCNGSGKVEISGDIFKCPRCKGYIEREKDSIEWYVSNSGKIGKIEITSYLNGNSYNKSGVNYMIDSTGIGSGTVYNEKNIFTSRKEAEKECIKRTEQQIEN